MINIINRGFIELVIIVMVINLGMNPVNGGKPPRDRSITTMERWIPIFLLEADLTCFVVNMLNCDIHLNRGMIIIEYTAKYIIEPEGLLIVKSLIIQPIWPIDE